MNRRRIPELVVAMMENQAAFAGLSDADAEWVIKNMKEAIRLFVSAVHNRANEELKVDLPLFEHIKTVSLGAVAGKDVSNCFRNFKRYCFRDPRLDKLLLKREPDQAKCRYLVTQLTRPTTLLVAVEDFLGITGDIGALSTALKLKGVVTTIPAIEVLIGRHDKGEDVGLKSHLCNILFVEKRDGSVSPLYVWCAEWWSLSIRELDRQDELSAGSRFLFRE